MFVVAFLPLFKFPLLWDFQLCLFFLMICSCPCDISLNVCILLKLSNIVYSE